MDVSDSCDGVNLQEKVVKRLEAMGKGKPKTLEKLKSVLKPFQRAQVVSVVEPFFALEELQTTFGEVKVKVQQAKLHKVNPATLEESLRTKFAATIGKQSGILCCCHDSENTNVVSSSLKTWVSETLKEIDSKKKSFTAGEFENQIWKRYLVENKQCDVFSAIADNLKETGFMSVSNDGKVTVEFPSDFTLACMKWILQTSENNDKMCIDQTRLSVAIRTVNRHLKELQKVLRGEKELNSAMKARVECGQVSEGVARLMKRGRHVQRLRNQTSNSRSRSRSPLSKSRSGSTSRWSSGPSDCAVYSTRSTTSVVQKTAKKDSLTAKQRVNIVDRLTGGLAGLTLGTTTFIQDSLASLCQGVHKLTVGDVKLIPLGLRLTSIHSLVEIGKMGASRPKTVKALQNALVPMTRRVFAEVRFQQLFETKGNQPLCELAPLKRKRQILASRRQRGSDEVIVGREPQFVTVTVDPVMLFYPDAKKIQLALKPQQPKNRAARGLEATRDLTAGPVERVVALYRAECEKLVNLVTKHSERLALHRSSAVVKDSDVTAAASRLHKRLTNPSSKNEVVKTSDVKWEPIPKIARSASREGVAQVSDATEPSESMEIGDPKSVAETLKTFKSRDQLLWAIAECCVACEKHVSVDDLTARLFADGFVRLVPGSDYIEFPEQRSATSMYAEMRTQLNIELKQGFRKFEANVANRAKGEIDVMEKAKEESDKKKEEERKKKEQRSSLRGRGAFRGKRRRLGGPAQ